MRREGALPGHETTTPASPVPGAASSPRDATRFDLDIIAELIPEGARVVDVGCGDGGLLALLQDRRRVDGRGIELSQSGVNECVARGLSVIQGDADRDLVHYPDAAFDYAVLSQTIQATYNPRLVLVELLRIAERVVVSFPNFGHWRVRVELLAKGRMPVTSCLPQAWYDTPNIHYCTIRDFVALAEDLGATVEQAIAINRHGDRISMTMPWAFWNVFGQQAVFVLKR